MTVWAIFMTVSTNEAVDDILSDVLDALEPAGALFFRGSFAAPWQIRIPKASEVLRMIGQPPGIDTVVMFHAVLRGSPTLRMRGQRFDLAAGDLLLLNLAHEHQMGEGDHDQALTMAEVVAGSEFKLPLVFDAGSQGTVKLICGGFFLRNVAQHPLMQDMPELVRISSGERFDKVAYLLSMLAQECDVPGMGSKTVINRILDLLFVELLRKVIAERSDTGWLAALRDPVLRKAFSVIHAAPGADWSVADIAREVGISTSGLNLRFRSVLGQSPAKYLTMWRMNLAGRLLDKSDDSLAVIARSVGYESVEAFSRKFKAYHGVAPGAWRRTPAGR